LKNSAKPSPNPIWLAAGLVQCTQQAPADKIRFTQKKKIELMPKEVPGDKHHAPSPSYLRAEDLLNKYRLKRIVESF
jgi:hypothetical protein